MLAEYKRTHSQIGNRLSNYFDYDNRHATPIFSDSYIDLNSLETLLETLEEAMNNQEEPTYALQNIAEELSNGAATFRDKTKYPSILEKMSQHQFISILLNVMTNSNNPNTILQVLRITFILYSINTDTKKLEFYDISYDSLNYMSNKIASLVVDPNSLFEKHSERIGYIEDGIFEFNLNSINLSGSFFSPQIDQSISVKIVNDGLSCLRNLSITYKEVCEMIYSAGFDEKLIEISQGCSLEQLISIIWILSTTYLEVSASSERLENALSFAYRIVKFQNSWVSEAISFIQMLLEKDPNLWFSMIDTTLFECAVENVASEKYGDRWMSIVCNMICSNGESAFEYIKTKLKLSIWCSAADTLSDNLTLRWLHYTKRIIMQRYEPAFHSFVAKIIEIATERSYQLKRKAVIVALSILSYVDESDQYAIFVESDVLAQVSQMGEESISVLKKIIRTVYDAAIRMKDSNSPVFTEVLHAFEDSEFNALIDQCMDADDDDLFSIADEFQKNVLGYVDEVVIQPICM